MDPKTETELVETVEQRNADHVRRMLAVPALRAVLERGDRRRTAVPNEAVEARR